MRSAVEAKVMEQLETLPEEMQQRVLEYVHALQLLARRGVPGTRLLPFAGTIAQDDLELMRQAIEEECERVDPNDW
jgi:hypothetical protein